ncbi:MAG: DUF4169 family protein [Pseudomonadota bacterium]
MADLINLNKARKAKARVDKQARAAANRVKHGRTKTEKAVDSANTAKLSKLIDGSKREEP